MLDLFVDNCVILFIKSMSVKIGFLNLIEFNNANVWQNRGLNVSKRMES